MPTNPTLIQFNFEEDEPVPTQEEILLDDIEEQILEDEPNRLKVPDISKQEIVTEDVFDMPNLAVLPDDVKQDIDLEMAEQGTTMEKENKIQKELIKAARPKRQPKLKKNGQPRKPMTEDHKRKLALAREKAAEGRERAKKKREEQKAREKEEKELLKKKKEKDFQRLKKEVEEEEAEPPMKVEVKPQQKGGYTKEDMEQATFNAIAQYEILRKQRKEEKRKVEALEREKQEVIHKLKPQAGYRARHPNGRLLNPYDACF